METKLYSANKIGTCLRRRFSLSHQNADIDQILVVNFRGRFFPNLYRHVLLTLPRKYFAEE